MIQLANTSTPHYCLLRLYALAEGQSEIYALDQSEDFPEFRSNCPCGHKKNCSASIHLEK
jgi:hypothetical protein